MSARPPGLRILVGGVAVGSAVLLATGGLLAYALAGVAAGTEARHRDLAERLFDEMEGELSALVTREEGRSFLEYRYFYVPAESVNYDNTAGLVVSELSRPPADPWVVGWFQIDPGDVVSSPRVPRANETTLALTNGTWSNDAGALDELGRIRSVVSRVAWPAAAPDPPEVAANPAPSSLGTSTLNRGVLKRSQRALQVVQTKELNLSSFNPSEEPVGELVKQQAAGPPAPDPDVNVVVTPLAGVRTGGHLVLYRTVKAATEEHRQGLVLAVPALARHLEDSVLGPTELRGAVSLGWDGAPGADRRYRFAHRFAEPFGSMTVVADLDELPELASRDAATVPLLGGVVLLSVLGGGLALYAAVRSELAYARRRNDFVAAVSHELKTPLTTIRLYAEMLRDGMVPGADRQRTYHHTITMESERLGRLIANVLELARLERGGAAPEVVVGPVEPVVADAIEIVRPHAAAAGFAIELHAAPDLPPVRVDRDALTQIVVNLVDNSVKFAGDGERRIELHLVPHELDGVELLVRDHGPGVPRAHLRKVFEPFWRGERELTRKTRGTGIGLALVRGLAERMGARVVARNHPGGGLEVALRLAEA